MRRISTIAALLALVLLALPTAASAHPERKTYYPVGAAPVPSFRTGGPTLVVCKADSRRRIERNLRGPMRRKNLALLKRCHFRNVQTAVNRAKNGTRILLLPGVYREEPSRKVPVDDPKCKNDYEITEGFSTAPPPAGPRSNDPPQRPNYEYQFNCPNSKNLIAIIGDRNKDRKCDSKCNLQIEGTARVRDVVIEGDQRKADVIRGDRVDGIALRRFTIQYGEFNNIDILETNGFHLSEIITRYAQNYGALTFTSDHGLYERIEAYNNGDSGVYPGSGPEGHCLRYGIEIRNVRSHDNVLGYSGTAGNGVWVHDSRFFRNATGLSTDSFASGHPGMPQDCAKWENNRFYSNNNDLFNNQRDAYCKGKKFFERDPKIVCPQFQVPVGSGIIMYGANKNLVRNNYIYDNWRSGVRLFHVPAAIRGDNDPADAMDTSHGNQFLNNHMGVNPAGVRDLNGRDFDWDGQGQGNCFQGNAGAGGAKVTSDPAPLPTCPGSSIPLPGDGAKLLMEVPCAAWDPGRNDDPPGCSWFTQPPEPK